MEPTVMSAKHDLFEVGERCEITPLAVQTKINMPSFYIRILKLSFFRLRLLMYPCIKFLQILNYWHNLCAETSSKLNPLKKKRRSHGGIQADIKNDVIKVLEVVKVRKIKLGTK